VSKLRLAAGMDHIVEGPQQTDIRADSAPDVGRVTVAADLAPGQVLRVTKFLAYSFSSAQSAAAVRDEVVAALAEARHTGWQGLLDAQRAYLDDFWARADVELDGDAELQQALRFALFHARSPPRASPAPGTTATPSGMPSASSSPC
jgi:alpha,alpha-trehalose phosphorylase